MEYWRYGSISASGDIPEAPNFSPSGHRHSLISGRSNQENGRKELTHHASSAEADHENAILSRLVYSANHASKKSTVYMKYLRLKRFVFK